jgi:hypothetical protein
MLETTMKILTVPLLALGLSTGCDSASAAGVDKLQGERANAPDEPAAARPPIDHAAIRARLAERRELADAYAAGTLGDRLRDRSLLLVDPTPAEGSAVHFFLYTGAIDPGAELAALKAAKGSDGEGPTAILLGGEDSTRPAIFREVDPGAYTVCALVAPTRDREAERLIAEVAAEVEADDARLAQQVAEASAEVERRLGRPVDKLRFDGAAPRCANVVVDDDARSRVVVLGGEA